MNDILIKKLQLNKLKNLSKEMEGICFLEYIAMEDENISRIKKFLSGMSCYNYPVTYTLKDITKKDDIVTWIMDQLMFVQDGNDIFISLIDSDKWMCKVKIVNVRRAFIELLSLSDICFYDINSKMGVYIGINEDEYYINLKNTASNEVFI